MLSSMLKDYQSKQAVQKENLEKRKNETLQSAIALCNKVSDDLNNQVAIAYCNQKKIDAALKIFQKNYNDFQKMCVEWSSLSNKINDLLKRLMVKTKVEIITEIPNPHLIHKIIFIDNKLFVWIF
ncbi:GCN5-like protein 1 [Trichinella nativa]|uniref:GCN5-like protein 1 n=1 Tax=Trichinella nativa TaxID=6335 RepID=A0A1Y3ERP7_9BILA|nr:GCN5-like protein 1 [Trichinella nativa]